MGALLHFFHFRPTLRKPFSRCVKGFRVQRGVLFFEHHLITQAKAFPLWQRQLLECDMSSVEVTKHTLEIPFRMYFAELQPTHSRYFTRMHQSSIPTCHRRMQQLVHMLSESNVVHPQRSIYAAKNYALLSALNHIQKENYKTRLHLQAL